MLCGCGFGFFGFLLFNSQNSSQIKY